MKTGIQQGVCTLMFIATLFTVTRTQIQPKCPSRMDKKDMIHTHNGIFFSHEKKNILPHVTSWMDLEHIILSERSQTEKDKFCMMIVLLCGI